MAWDDEVRGMQGELEELREQLGQVTMERIKARNERDEWKQASAANAEAMTGYQQRAIVMEAERDAARGEVATLAALVDAQDMALTDLQRDLEAYRGARAECERQYQEMLREAAEQVHRAERAEDACELADGQRITAEREVERLGGVLKWYAERARSLARYLSEKKMTAVEAVITELSLDAGKHAALSGQGAPDAKWSQQDAEMMQAEITQLHKELERLTQEPFRLTQELSLRADQVWRLKKRLREVVDLGHNDDCIFCGLKDKIALSGQPAPTARDALVEAAVGLRLFEGREKQNLPAYVAYFEPGDWYRFVDAVAAYLKERGDV